jgi:PAS domain S-box-containing protein
MRSEKRNSEDPSFYKDILENLCAIVFTYDLETQEYIWGNEKFGEILGYSRDEIYMNAKEFAKNYFHPDDIIILQQRNEYFIKNNGAVWSGVYRIKHKEGHYVWIYSKFKVYKRDEKGNPKQLLGIVVDAVEKFETRKRIAELFKERVRLQNHERICNLTLRELEIIRLIASGGTYLDIAEKLCIQPDTVNKHRKNILEKLNFNNIAALISFAKETGLA